MVTLDGLVYIISRPSSITAILAFSFFYYSSDTFTKILICSVIYTTVSHWNTKYKQRGYWEKLGSQDIALITGGSNGLGLEITNLLISKEVKVVNLDKVAPEVHSGAHFIECDLSDESQIFNAIESIKKRFGIPTILVNNAAVRHSETLLDLDYRKIKDILQINTLSQVILLKEIIKDVQVSKRLYVVTIASILGLVSPSHLSIYSATKSALVSLHDSLSHEMKRTNIRFLLATPGQLDTKLFEDVKPPRQFFAPVIRARDLAHKIVDKIELGERGTLHGPLYTYFIPALRLLPFSFGEYARSFSQMDTSVKVD